jgi:demethylmenaquinone methyltransferase/2-methoxy-6-polyprenyl-1,4-benzoquinol methylase
LRRGDKALDLAGGTGDLAILLERKVGPDGRVVLCDINAAMLEQGKRRLLDRGVVGNVEFLQANAEALPLADRSFRCVTIAFGLRNVTDKQRALEEMYRVLEPGGQALILEFSHPPGETVKKLYDHYSFEWLPMLGQVVAGDRDSYQYLVESIRRHPDQETLAAMMRHAGFEQVRYENLTGGIVAMHRGYRV